MSQDAVQLQAELLKAMAHPFRLRLLRELGREEECVCHLSALLQRPQPYVSHQLAALRDAGLVSDRREGQRIYYRVSDPRALRILSVVDEMAGAPDTVLAAPRAAVAGCPCPKCGDAPRIGHPIRRQAAVW